MYVCLCKGLTEAEVVQRTRAAIKDGLVDPADMIDVLDLACEESCGFCVENPDLVNAIFEDELESHRGYATASESPVPSA